MNDKELIFKDTLNNTVIENGFCIGCGACSLGDNSPYSVSLNKYGLYEASYKSSGTWGDEVEEEASKLCPFSDQSKNETEISDIFLKNNPHNDKKVGRYSELFAGNVLDEGLRSKASSGGVARWIAKELREKDKVDAVIQVYSNENSSGDVVFKYSISDEVDDIVNASTSAYHPVTMQDVLNRVISEKKRYLIVGVPCFIKAVRLISLNNPEFSSRIAYTMSIFCGHFKSKAYGELIAWQQGIKPEDITKINFRGKSENHKASIKTFEVESSDKSVSAQSKDLFGTNYGLGFFKPLACDACDDVFGETADVVIGDAWLPQYVSDYRGTSLIISRNNEITEMLRSGVKEQSLKLDVIQASDVVDSQIGGYRHKKQGIKLRLFLMKKKKNWVPRKRLKPVLTSVFFPRKKVYTLRYQISMMSHDLFLKAKDRDNLNYFIDSLSGITKKYKVALKTDPFFIFSKVKADPFGVSKSTYKSLRKKLKKAYKRYI